jgi:hypothetical protein
MLELAMLIGKSLRHRRHETGAARRLLGGCDCYSGARKRRGGRKKQVNREPDRLPASAQPWHGMSSRKVAIFQFSY